MLRLVFVTLLCGLLFAQQSSTPSTTVQEPQQGADQPTTFTIGVEQVVVPTLVLNKRGDGYVSGLRPDQFRLFDNGKEQNINVYETFTPISMVILVQANARAEKILQAVNKIGSLVQPIITGDQGEAAVIAFDSRVRTVQDFTNDPDKISKAVKGIYPGSTSSRLVDAMDQGVRMLRSREAKRRRIMLVIAESRDYGSEGRGRETLVSLQLSNVATYWVNMSHLLGILTQAPPEPRPDPLPPAMHPLPPNVAATPNTVMQTYGTNGNRAEFVPLMVEIFKGVKSIFTRPAAEVFTKGTGGNEFPFYSQHGLEEALQRIGEQLHSQYVLSYSPNNKEEGGFHTISVDVPGYDYTTQTRPGYWLAAKQ